MPSNIETLRPGFLISLKTSVRGNVQYTKVGGAETLTAGRGKAVAEWETTRVIADPDEFKKAGEARSKANSIIRSASALLPRSVCSAPRRRKRNWTRRSRPRTRWSMTSTAPRR